MVLTLLLLAGLPALVAGSFTHNMRSSLCETMRVPGLCEEGASEYDHSALNQIKNGKMGKHTAQCTGTNCCSTSSCYAIPWSKFQCDKSRGPTQCIGAKMFPYPSVGMCRCKYGACSIAGMCPTAPQQALFEEHDDVTPVPMEDFSEPFAFLGFGLLAFSGLSTLLVVRLRRRGRGRAQEMSLISPVDADSEAFPEDVQLFLQE